MNILKEYPPNYEEIRKHFNPGREVVFTYGKNLYNPHDLKIMNHLLEHEKVHARQQGASPEVWWNKYFENKEFRLEQETEAYATQYNFVKESLNDEGQKIFLEAIAQDLAGELYKLDITFQQAKTKIRHKAKSVIE